MKKEIMKAWVAALRSRKYKQAQGELRAINRTARFDQKRQQWVEETKTLGFCCLGVLCNLHAQAHPKIAKTQLDPNYYLGETGVLPPAVLKWAGMDTRDGEFEDEDGEVTTLAELNDDGAKFGEIAKVIEKNWKDL